MTTTYGVHELLGFFFFFRLIWPRVMPFFTKGMSIQGREEGSPPLWRGGLAICQLPFGDNTTFVFIINAYFSPKNLTQSKYINRTKPE